MTKRLLPIILFTACVLSVIAADVNRHWVLTVHRTAGYTYHVWRNNPDGSKTTVAVFDETETRDETVIDLGSTTNVMNYQVNFVKVVPNAGLPFQPAIEGRQRPIIRLPVRNGRQYEIKYSGRADFGGALLSVTNTPVYSADGFVTVIDDAFAATEPGRVPFLHGVASNRFYRITEIDPSIPVETNSPARVTRIE